jgi:hypothetical protein
MKTNSNPLINENFYIKSVYRESEKVDKIIQTLINCHNEEVSNSPKLDIISI